MSGCKVLLGTYFEAQEVYFHHHLGGLELLEAKISGCESSALSRD